MVPKLSFVNPEMPQPGCGGTQPRGLTAWPGFFWDAGKSFSTLGYVPKEPNLGICSIQGCSFPPYTHIDRDPTTQRAWLEPSHSHFMEKGYLRIYGFPKAENVFPVPQLQLYVTAKCPQSQLENAPVPTLIHGQGEGI